MSAAGTEYCFLTTADLVKAGGKVTALGASARLGSLAPAKALTRLGYDARTFSVAGDTALAEEAVRVAKRVVFGEMFQRKGSGWAIPIATYRRLFDATSAPRERVVFSIADDHFDQDDFLAFYREVLPDCLAVTAVSELLAQRMRDLTSRPVLVAPEPYEGRRGAPHAFVMRKPAAPFAWLARRIGLTEDHWRLRLLWFGYPQNLPALFELIPALEDFSGRQPLLLTLVTLPFAEMNEILTPVRMHPDARLRVHFLPWSPLVMDPAIANSDVVLIPSKYRDPIRQAKSPNRLVAGLHGGRLVVAHPLPAYAPYADCAWVGEDLCAGLDWAMRHPHEVIERIARGQTRIDQLHSGETVARFWLDVFHPKN